MPKFTANGNDKGHMRGHLAWHFCSLAGKNRPGSKMHLSCKFKVNTFPAKQYIQCACGVDLALASRYNDSCSGCTDTCVLCSAYMINKQCYLYIVHVLM